MNRHRRVFERTHGDLFGDSAYFASFFNYSVGSYDPNTGEMSSQSRRKFAEAQAEIVPPGMDTTVETDGTSFSWDTSIRFPLDQGNLTVADGDTYTVPTGETEYYDTVTVDSGGTLVIDGTLITEFLTDNGTTTVNGTLTVLNETFVESLTPLGEDAERPTEVEIKDDAINETDRYELHGYSYEKGSGMVMCRLVEQ